MSESAEDEEVAQGSDLGTNGQSLNLRAEWDSFDHENSHSTTYLHLCEKAIDVGESLLAYDIAKKGLDKYPNHKQLGQKAGLSLKNAGSPLKASVLLSSLLEKHPDMETCSLLASSYKDLWEYASDPEKKKVYAALAIDHYKKGLAATTMSKLKASHQADNYYPCINVAFLYFVALRNYDEAREYAQQALRICQNLISSGKTDYWVLATAAEAQLIYGHLEDAMTAYASAVACPGAKPAHIASTRAQSMKIAELYDAHDQLAKVFPVLGIVAFSGHMIDRPGANERFPVAAEELVKNEIMSELEHIGAS
ncbi:MAG: tetratricopeptide repeat-containing protein, partial [Opitutales bacterium]